MCVKPKKEHILQHNSEKLQLHFFQNRYKKGQKSLHLFVAFCSDFAYYAIIPYHVSKKFKKNII